MKNKSEESRPDKKPTEPSMELSDLTDYHWQRSRAAQKAVEEMAKHPYTLEEAKAQVARKYARREEGRGTEKG